jgi:hypothetical protein
MIASLFLILAVSHILFDPPAKFLMEEQPTARGNSPSISCNPDGYLL